MPEIPQDSQVPEQVLLQQNPSMQRPETQALPALHVAPFSFFFTQDPLLQ
jgi:hypothetical protein